MWLHSLQRMNEQGPSLEVDGPIRRGDGALGGAPRPEAVAHASPWVRQVCAKQSLAILAGHEAGCGLTDGQVDGSPRVCHRLDGVVFAVGRELDCAVLGVEVALVLAEFDILELGRAPQEVLLLLFGVEDLGVELAGCADAAVQILNVSRAPVSALPSLVVWVTSYATLL